MGILQLVHWGDVTAEDKRLNRELWDMRMELRRFAFFLAVGLLTAILYFGMLVLFLDGLKVEYRSSVSVAYLCAIVLHFALNRLITFQSSEERAFVQAGRYVVMAIGSYVITIALVSYLVETFGFSVYASVIVALAVTTVVGYCVSKLWVFRRRAFRNE